jgi:lipid-A-disaccharide synthase
MGRPFSMAIVAGEHSGDTHGGNLVKAFEALAPGSRWFGAGGPVLASAGVECLVPMERLAVVGIGEVVAHLPSLWLGMRTLKRALLSRRPEALLLVDFPDFNFRLARFAKDHGIKVVYYITPQVWAWRQGRTGFLKKYVDRAMVIFPFEESFLAERGVEARFVGHPLAGSVRADSPLEEFLKRHELAPSTLRVALLPGSRASEIERNLPPMLGAAGILASRHPNLACFVPWAAGLPESLRKRHGGSAVRWVEGEYRDVLGHAHAAAVASGTATLEAALLGVPQVIVYRLKPVTYAVGSRLVTLKKVGLPNIVLGEGAIPELIQADFTAERTAAELERLLDEPEISKTRAEVLSREIKARLGEGNASLRAAKELLSFLEGSGAVGS